MYAYRTVSFLYRYTPNFLRTEHVSNSPSIVLASFALVHPCIKPSNDNVRVKFSDLDECGRAEGQFN